MIETFIRETARANIGKQMDKFDASEGFADQAAEWVTPDIANCPQTKGKFMRGVRIVLHGVFFASSIA